MDLLRRHEKKNHASLAAQQEAIPTRPEQIGSSTQLAPSNVTNATEDDVYAEASYMLMPAQHTPATDQTSTDILSTSLQHPTNSNFWISGTYPSPSYDMTGYLQSCFMQNDMSQLENMSSSQDDSQEMNFAKGANVSKSADCTIFNFETHDRFPTPQGSSILSRPGSPPLNHTHFAPIAVQSVKPRSIQLTDERHKVMQQQVYDSTSVLLPSRSTLTRFIQAYFRTFHKHQPFLHEPSWSPITTPIPLVLAVCANGALYSLERDIAIRLHGAALAMLGTHEKGLWALQTMMQLIAFSAWDGDSENLRTVLQLQSRLTIALRREWILFRPQIEAPIKQWSEWIEIESMKR